MTTAAATSRSRIRNTTRWRLQPALLLAPALLFVIGPVIYPIGLEAWLSLTDAGIGDQGHFIGLANYAALVQSPFFRQAALNTIIFAAGGASLKALVGGTAAFALATSFPGRRVVYALLVLPFAFPVVIGSIAWYFLLSAGGEGAIDFGCGSPGGMARPRMLGRCGVGPRDVDRAAGAW